MDLIKRCTRYVSLLCFRVFHSNRLMKKNKSISLERKLFIYFFALSIIPTIFMGFISYNRAYFSLEDKISKSSQQVIDQTVSSLNYILAEYDNNLKQVYTSSIFQSEIQMIIDNNDNAKKLAAIKNINKILRNHLISKNNIYGIAVMFEDQNLCLESGKPFVNMDYKNADIYKDTMKAKDTLWISTAGYKNLMKDSFTDEEGVISLSRNIVSTTSLKKIGITAMAVREELLLDVISSIQLESGSSIFILDNNHIVSFKNNGLSEKLYNDKKFIAKINNEIKKEKGQYFTFKYDRDRFLINYGHVDANGWKVLSIIPYGYIMEQADEIKNFTFITLFICTILVFFISKMLSVILVKPLKSLEKSMQKIQEGNFNETISFSTCKEIDHIGSSFNMMSKKLKDLMDEIGIKEQEKAEAEFKFLQSQINPHFLYNTLDSIKGMVICNKSDEAILTLEKLSDFFRIVLRQSGKVIPLEKELKYAENYLSIQKLRNIDKFEYEIIVDPNIADMKILRFILQPIIENAINHGIRQKRGKGFISITCSRDSKDAIIEIKDTGIGIEIETLDYINKRLNDYKYEAVESGKGIGIINVNRRIKLYYGEAYGLTYESIKGEWTKARINIPYIQ